MVTSTGKTIPSGSFCVLALNCLQKSMMLTPWGPSAVPTGGAGVALPAGSCSLIVVCTFFGGIVPLPQSQIFLPRPRGPRCSTKLLDAGKIQFDGSRAPENRYGNFQAAVIVVNFFHGTVEVGKRPIDNADLLVALENNFWFLAVLRGVHAIDDGVHFRFRKRRRGGGGTDKTGDA